MRTGDLSSALDVYFELLGEATNDDDFADIAGNDPEASSQQAVTYDAETGFYKITLLAGSDSASISIIPDDDADAELDEDVVLRVVERPEYTLGASTRATVSIEDNDAWVETEWAYDTSEPTESAYGVGWLLHSVVTELSETFDIQRYLDDVPEWLQNSLAQVFQNSCLVQARHNLVTGALFITVTAVPAGKVSYPRAVGQHFIPQSVADFFQGEGKLTREAYEFAMGCYSGQTTPNHSNHRPYGGVTHVTYNEEVNKALKAFMDNAGIDASNPMTGQQMEEFFKTKILDADPTSKIAMFNADVMQEREAFLTARGWTAGQNGQVKPPPDVSYEEFVDRGRNYRGGKKWVSARVVALLSFAGGLVISEGTTFASVTAESPHYAKAIDLMQAGNLDGGLDELLGSRRKPQKYGLYDELVDNNSAAGALTFAAAVENAYAQARDEHLQFPPPPSDNPDGWELFWHYLTD